jgi:hypothetical protein
MKHSRRRSVTPFVPTFFAMKKIITTAVLAAGFIAAVSFADSTSPAPASAPTEVDYVSQLPNPNDLVNTVGPEGAKVSKIVQTGSEITVTYANSNGQVYAVAYRLLPAAGSKAATPTVTASAVPTPSTPAPAVVYADAGPAYPVVYEQPAPVYYYPAYGYGYYYPWYSPVSVRLGFGFRGGWGFRGGFRGGFRR